MARHRKEGRAAARREEAEAEAERLRREARGWFLRAVMALAGGGLLFLLLAVPGVALMLAAPVFVVLGMRKAIAAQKVIEAA